MAIKAQTGCDEWCTFCIIPRTRGPLRSYPEAQIVDDVRRQVDRGVREVVLTGVHLGKYGDDRGETDALARLVDRLTAIDGLLRLRLSSVLPVQVTPALVARVRDDPKVCRHLHIPLQAGDDEVLAAMHRPYRIAEFLDRVEEAKAEIPGLGLSTDVIVGFPGETREQFDATLAVVDRVGFSKLHVFRYSRRPDTPAATMDGQVEDAEVQGGATVDAVVVHDGLGHCHLQGSDLVAVGHRGRRVDEDPVGLGRRADIHLDPATQPVDVGPQ